MIDFSNSMALGEVKTRKRISSAKWPFLNAVIGVLNDRQAFWPLSDRQIHYALLNAPPLIHASKPDSRYGNNSQSYKALTDLVTRARLTGEIPFACISDETRPVSSWAVHQDVQGFVQNELADLMKGYWRDLLQTQPNQVELLAEKNTLGGILKSIASEYCIPFTSGRGFCSLPPRYAMAERFRKSGKEKLVLLIVSDFNPEGTVIAQSFGRSLRDDFGIDGVEALKVALTAQQVQDFALPPGAKAKAGSATRKRFVEQFGENVYEVEALTPETLQSILRKAIDSILDIDAFNRELEQEKQDAGELETIRRRTHAAIAEATRS